MTGSDQNRSSGFIGFCVVLSIVYNVRTALTENTDYRYSENQKAKIRDTTEVF